MTSHSFPTRRSSDLEHAQQNASLPKVPVEEFEQGVA
jgi:hypothetical protein